MNAAQSLARLLAQGQLEVEDILAVARTGTGADVPALRVLERSLRDARPSEVPYKSWLGAVCAYLEGGYEAVLILAQSSENLPFVLGVLEELQSSSALEAVAKIAPHASEAGVEAVASAINNLVSLSSVAIPNEETRQALLAFLHAVILRCRPDEAAYGIALYALRGVGEVSSLEILAGLPDADEPYEGARDEAQACIARRCKAKGGGES